MVESFCLVIPAYVMSCLSKFNSLNLKTNELSGYDGDQGLLPNTLRFRGAGIIT